MRVITDTSSWQEKAITLIKDAEGFRSNVYTDTTGNQTIGYGFNLNNPYFSNISNSLNIKQADTILREYCSQNIFTNININNYSTSKDNVFAVIADMMYNLGTSGYESFTTFNGFLQSGFYRSAVADLVNTEWFGQVGLRSIRDAFNLLVHNNNFLYLIN